MRDMFTHTAVDYARSPESLHPTNKNAREADHMYVLDWVANRIPTYADCSEIARVLHVTREAAALQMLSDETQKYDLGIDVF